MRTCMTVVRSTARSTQKYGSGCSPPTLLFLSAFGTTMIVVFVLVPLVSAPGHVNILHVQPMKCASFTLHVKAHLPVLQVLGGAFETTVVSAL